MNLFVEEALALFTGPAFYDAKNVVIYLVPAIMLSQMYIFAPGIFIVKKTSYVIWINVFGAIVNVILNFLLIPFFGIIGAALATLIGHSLVFFIYMYFSQRFYSVPHNWNRILTVSFSVVILVSIIMNLPLTGVWFYLVRLIAILMVLLSFVVFQLIHINEIKILSHKLNDILTQFKKNSRRFDG